MQYKLSAKHTPLVRGLIVSSTFSSSHKCKERQKAQAAAVLCKIPGALKIGREARRKYPPEAKCIVKAQLKLKSVDQTPFFFLPQSCV